MHARKRSTRLFKKGVPRIRKALYLAPKVLQGPVRTRAAGLLCRMSRFCCRSSHRKRLAIWFQPRRRLLARMRALLIVLPGHVLHVLFGKTRELRNAVAQRPCIVFGEPGNLKALPRR